MKLANLFELTDHFFIASLILWFVVQHSALTPSPIKYGPTIVGQALQYQPRTPPPMLDPEQLDVSFQESETQPGLGLLGY